MQPTAAMVTRIKNQKYIVEHHAPSKGQVQGRKMINAEVLDAKESAYQI